MPRLRWAHFIILAFVTSATGQQDALATQPEPSTSASTLWVRHLLQASLIVKGDAEKAPKHYQIGTDLRLTVRISDHALDSDFFGSVVTTFRGLGSRQGPRTIWKDGKCHHYRGFPKVTVTRIEGTLSHDNRTTEITAAKRQIGMPLPKDEIVVTRRLTQPSTGILELATKAVTTESHLVFDLRVETRRCKPTVPILFHR